MNKKKQLFNWLTPSQINKKVDYIKYYVGEQNNATASLVDSNSNVSEKNMGTLREEMWKFENIQVSRKIIYDKITELYDEDLAKQYVKDIEDHLIYVHDETLAAFLPYCASVTMYPFLLEGTKCMGGTSKAPTNLQSFCGSFVNLVYQLATNWAGATATVEFLMYFDYFARKQYGKDYLNKYSKQVSQELQGVVYALNQPAAARGNQSVFWNISVFDKYYFTSIFEGFRFPDGTEPDWDSLSDLQDFFMLWFRKERTKELLTYPVLTVAMLLDDNNEPKDKEFAHKRAKDMANGLSFFLYESNSADSLASCCRLRNELADNTFSYTLGAGGVSTGSFRVITINMNRYSQKYEKDTAFSDLIQRAHKYLFAHRCVIKWYIDQGMLPAYTAGFVNFDNQFGTIGINGMLEAMEYKGFDPEDDMTGYQKEVSKYLGVIYKLNKQDSQIFKFRFNTEFVPAEGLGVKNAQWDKHDGLVVPRDCYNSYFFPSEGEGLTLLDKMFLHGEETTKFLDGGSACHLNIAQLLTPEQAYQLMCIAGKTGCNYWTFNCLVTICNDCGYINVNTEDHCTKCGSKDVDYGTRVIGYLKRISSYSKDRQKEAGLRFYNRT